MSRLDSTDFAVSTPFSFLSGTQPDYAFAHAGTTTIWVRSMHLEVIPTG